MKDPQTTPDRIYSLNILYIDIQGPSNYFTSYLSHAHCCRNYIQFEIHASHIPIVSRRSIPPVGAMTAHTAHPGTNPPSGHISSRLRSTISFRAGMSSLCSALRSHSLRIDMEIKLFYPMCSAE